VGDWKIKGTTGLNREGPAREPVGPRQITRLILDVLLKLESSVHNYIDREQIVTHSGDREVRAS
jgi:hypothetical protein